MIFDAHLHLVHANIPHFDENPGYTGLSCVLSKDEYLRQQKMISSIPLDSNIHFLTSFGIHPQKPDFTDRDFLTELLQQNRIDAIGECGFDFFTPEFKAQKKQQEEVWNFQLEAAVEYGKVMVVHGRKCTDRFFRDVKMLRKVPAVIFHSWAGTLLEARSLLKKGVNAYFSFGKPLINGKKSAIDCVKNLEAKRILLETDAPYQTLKNEEKTQTEDILKVYKTAELLRGEKLTPDYRDIF